MNQNSIFSWLMWFIKETLIKPYGSESMYFQHETSPGKYSQIFKKKFSNHLGKIFEGYFFYVVEACAMLVRSDSRKYVSGTCLYQGEILQGSTLEPLKNSRVNRGFGKIQG